MVEEKFLEFGTVKVTGSADVGSAVNVLAEIRNLNQYGST